MSTHPRVLDQLAELSKHARTGGKSQVAAVIEMATARIKKQDELLEDKLTVHDSYVLAALTGMCSRTASVDTLMLSNFSDCIKIADLMMELRRG